MTSKLKLTLSLLNICKIHYKMVFKVAHGAARVNRIKDFKVLLDAKGFNGKDISSVRKGTHSTITGPQVPTL